MAKNYTDKYGSEIAGDLGIPLEDISCPACGRRYGHHNTKVCKACEECSACCLCKHPELIPAKEAIQRIVLTGVIG